MKAIRFVLAVFLIVGCSTCMTGGMKIMQPDYSEHCPPHSMINDDGTVKYYGMYIRPHIRNKWVKTTEVRKLEKVTKGCVRHLGKVTDHNIIQMRLKSCDYMCQFKTFLKGMGSGSILTGIIILAIAL